MDVSGAEPARRFSPSPSLPSSTYHPLAITTPSLRSIVPSITGADDLSPTRRPSSSSTGVAGGGTLAASASPNRCELAGGVSGDGAGDAGETPELLGVVRSLRSHHPACNVRGVREVHQRRRCIGCGAPVLGHPGGEFSRSSAGDEMELLPRAQSASSQHCKAAGGCSVQDSAGCAAVEGSAASPAVTVATGDGRSVRGGPPSPAGFNQAFPRSRHDIEPPPWPGDHGKKVEKYQVCAGFGGETYSSMEGVVYRLPGCATPPMLEAARPSSRGTA